LECLKLYLRTVNKAPSEPLSKRAVYIKLASISGSVVKNAEICNPAWEGLGSANLELKHPLPLSFWSPLFYSVWISELLPRRPKSCIGPGNSNSHFLNPYRSLQMNPRFWDPVNSWHLVWLVHCPRNFKGTHLNSQIAYIARILMH
jgi:hypothetical protein